MKESPPIERDGKASLESRIAVSSAESRASIEAKAVPGDLRPTLSRPAATKPRLRSRFATRLLLRCPSASACRLIPAPTSASSE